MHPVIRPVIQPAKKAPRAGSYSRPQSKKEPKKPPAWRAFIERVLRDSADELLIILAASLGALVRAMGVQVQSGYAGLLFTKGRAGQVLDHGFRPLIPFIQQVVMVPIRSRTMDLPSQKVVNRDGLVYLADANLVYHVHDVHKAVIEIDVLEKGMLQMLTLGVQEVLRDTTRETITKTEQLEVALKENLSRRLGDWGVTIDKTGFPSLTPSPQSLRITQLQQQVDERCKRYETFLERGHQSARALALVGTRRFPQTVRQTRIRSEFERYYRRRRIARTLTITQRDKKKKKKK